MASSARVRVIVATLVGSLGLASGGTAIAVLSSLTFPAHLAPVPPAAVVAGAALAVPAVMAPGGVAGLRAGYLIGAAGAALAYLSAGWGSLPALTLSCLLLGAGNTAIFFSRYVAARQEGAASERAIGQVLFATSIGAVLSPLLIGPSAGLAMARPAVTGILLVTAVLYLCASAVLSFRDMPRAGSRPGSPGPGRMGGAGSALAVLAVANAAMVAVMTVGAIHLERDLGPGPMGIVISAHVLAMFAPSPLTGRLLGIYGTRTGYGLAALCSALAAGAMLAGHGIAATVAALVLIGLAWNAAVMATGVILAHSSLGRLDAAGLGEVLIGISGLVGTVASMLILPHLPAHHIILITTAAAAITLTLLALPSPQRQPRAS